MKAAVLFVDDNENILQGLRRNLRPMHQEWDINFANGGIPALKIMQEKHIDVVVSDIRMPGMDGSELLKQVKELYGHTIRMVLSGQCEEEVIIKLLGVSHQYMAKPFDTGTLISSIKGMLAARSQLQDEGLKKFITSLTALPSVPRIHEKIIAELKAASPVTQTLEDLFLRDISLAAKIFQVMNSSYFGTNQDINTIAYVWELLGLEKIKALIIDGHIIAPLDKRLESDPFIQELWDSSLTTARIARLIAKSENLPPKMSDKAWVAGLLHAVGAVILYTYQLHSAGSVDHSKLLDAANPQNAYPLVGGFLAFLWGLPQDIRFAILHHAEPRKAGDAGDKNILAIVHVAWALAHTRKNPPQPETAYLDQEFLSQTNALDKLQKWKMASAMV